MVYRKTYKRKSNYKRKSYKPKSKWGGYANTAMKALTIASKVARLVNIETKEANKYNSGTITYNATIISMVDQVAQGITDNTRVGDSIKVQKLTLKGKIQNTGSSANSQVFRLLLVNDKSNTGAPSTDLFEDSGSNYAPWSKKNPDNKYKTQVLYDSGIINTVGDTSSSVKIIDITVTPNMHVQYTAGTQSVASNNLKWYLISDSASSATSSYLLTSSVFYTDD